MSKSFEQAYKELSQNEAPDLWNRIEAGLTDKSTSEHTGKEKKPKGKRALLFIRRHSGTMAAVICAAIIIPAFIYMSQSGKKSFQGNSTAMYEAAGAYDAAAPMEAATEEEPEEVAAEDTTSNEDAVSEDSTEDPDTAAMMADTEGASEESATGSSKEGIEMQKQGTLEAAGKEEGNILSDGTVIQNVRVYVKEVNNVPAEADEGTLPGSLYTVEIVEDSSGTFAEGQSIELYVSVHSSAILVEEEIYQIEIRYDSKEKYPYSLVKSQIGNEE